MKTAKLFSNGRSQAVRLPKEYRFEGDEISIQKMGDIVLLCPKGNKMERFLSLGPIADDVGEGILEARKNEQTGIPRISL